MLSYICQIKYFGSYCKSQIMTFKTKKEYYKTNGKKGGRPKQDSDIHKTLPGYELVILTPTQYDSLIEKYGYKLLHKALEIFNNWLIHGGKLSEQYLGKNNYAHFRSDGWVINEARRSFNSY